MKKNSTVELNKIRKKTNSKPKKRAVVPVMRETVMTNTEYCRAMIILPLQNIELRPV